MSFFNQDSKQRSSRHAGLEHPELPVEDPLQVPNPPDPTILHTSSPHHNISNQDPSEPPMTPPDIITTPSKAGTNPTHWSPAASSQHQPSSHHSVNSLALLSYVTHDPPEDHGFTGNQQRSHQSRSNDPEKPTPSIYFHPFYLALTGASCVSR